MRGKRGRRSQSSYIALKNIKWYVAICRYPSQRLQFCKKKKKAVWGTKFEGDVFRSMRPFLSLFLVILPFINKVYLQKLKHLFVSFINKANSYPRTGYAIFFFYVNKYSHTQYNVTSISVIAMDWSLILYVAGRHLTT